MALIVTSGWNFTWNVLQTTYVSNHISLVVIFIHLIGVCRCIRSYCQGRRHGHGANCLEQLSANMAPNKRSYLRFSLLCILYDDYIENLRSSRSFLNCENAEPLSPKLVSLSKNITRTYKTAIGSFHHSYLTL